MGFVDSSGLNNFLNTDTATGTTIDFIPGADDPVARIRIRIRIRISQVPEPATMALFASGLGLMMVGVRRRGQPALKKA
ncbi:MAG: PEP-CTERM sorting domain-containing protein [Gammaproteobacteria bacterium]|nr:PEP-CTERM sorting domain-containing protein [Gammaproteobacteria bacterium]